MIGEILHERLATFEATAALVDGRIYPVALPQEPVLPAIVYDEQSDDSGEGTGHIVRKRLRVICFALSYAQAKQVGTAVLRAVRGYRREDTVPPLANMEDDSRNDAFIPERGFYGDFLSLSAWVVEE